MGSIRNYDLEKEETDLSWGRICCHNMSFLLTQTLSAIALHYVIFSTP
jgi:hypothetical protein